MNTETLAPTNVEATVCGHLENGRQASVAPTSKKSLASGGPLFENLLWRLQAQHAEESTLVVGFSGLGRQAGTTTMAAQLAVTAASQQPDRVLLIDANTGAPRLHKLFGVESKFGFSDVFSGEHPLEECPPLKLAENLDLLPIGQAGQTSSIRVHHRMVEAVVEKISKDYGLVVVDFPPANQLGSTTTLARCLSGLLLVVRAEKGKRHEAERIADRLEQDQIPLWGSILNRHYEYVPQWLR